VRATGTFHAADARATAQEVGSALSAWGVRTSAPAMWAASAAERVRDAEGAQWTVEWDEDLRLVSFEVWQAGHRLFGLDDWLG
jgi:hypothetical protein